MADTITNTIALIGILFTFLVGSAGLIVSLINTRKTDFNNAITNSRIKYIQEFRDTVSKYCSLLNSYSKIATDSSSEKEKPIMLELIDKQRYQLLLYLNPENKDWDQELINRIEKLRNFLNSEDEMKKQIDELIVFIQYLLKLEWECAKLESKNGIISEREQINLNKEYYSKYMKTKEKMENKEKTENKRIPWWIVFVIILFAFGIIGVSIAGFFRVDGQLNWKVIGIVFGIGVLVGARYIETIRNNKY